MKVSHRFEVLVLGLIVSAIAGTISARAQVTDEQRSAIRASCRSDFMSNCSGVQPGGAAAFQCLQQNMSKLSAACKSAVSAVTPQETSKEVPKETPKETPKAAAAPPKTEAPKAEAPKAEPPPKAETASPAPKKEPAPAKETKSSAPPKTAAAPSSGTPPKAATAKPASAPPQTAAAPATPPLVLRPMRPLEELGVMRSACGADARVLCGSVQPGQGRIIQCLASQPDALSSTCKEVLAQFSAER